MITNEQAKNFLRDLISVCVKHKLAIVGDHYDGLAISETADALAELTEATIITAEGNLRRVDWT